MGIVARARKRAFEVMEVARPDDHLSRTVDGLIMTLVVGNVLAEILGSVESIGRLYHDLFLGFEQASIAAFSAELVFRFWAAREKPGEEGHPWRSRFRYARSPMAIIDLAAIAPFYLSAFFAIDLRFLRILRLLRLIKLTRYSTGMNRMAEVFKMQRNALTTSFFFLGIAIVLSASVLHIVERDVQPEAFGSIPAAMWWAVCTLTTVGYGDVLPITAFGKLIASFITIIGIGVVALPTSLFASGFAHVMNRSEKALENEARKALADGVVTRREATDYEHLAESLYIEPDIAGEIIEAARQQQYQSETFDCPHCGKSVSG